MQQFEYNLEDNIWQLHQELKNKIYQHSNYISFYITDPKLRHIHKAEVKDRIVHHALFRILYPIFDKSFIFNSYSCRINKGTHKAVKRLKIFLQKISKNNNRIAYALKCDISKFFNSVDQEILLSIIQRKIKDKNVIWLMKRIIKSYNKGIPLGNVTSQLFANIYLNELDQFIKHKLKIKYYIRYTDDFIIVHEDKQYLENIIPIIKDFLQKNLKLNLHPHKIILRKYIQGIDFLGYVLLPYYTILRTKTKKRMFRKIKENKLKLNQKLIFRDSFEQFLQSYYGILKHCNSEKIKLELKNI